MWPLLSFPLRLFEMLFRQVAVRGRCEVASVHPGGGVRSVLPKAVA